MALQGSCRGEMLEYLKRHFIETLDKKRQDVLPDSPPEYLNIISDAVHTSLNLISRSDALYHDVEHTCLVTLCGQEIFSGKKVLEGELDASDWLHYTVALLFHDIGYVRNILPGDDDVNQIINTGGDTYEMKMGQTDASLTPYHVERGKMFVNNRKWNEKINKDILINLISYTQFPIPNRPKVNNSEEKKLLDLAGLVGSSDLIGQLADPMYDVKIPRLFYEFEETGSAKKMGYETPTHLRDGFPSFYMNFVRPHVSEALNYLKITEKGREWIAGLNYHVFSQSHKAQIEKSGIDLITELSELDFQNQTIESLIQIILEKVCQYKEWPIGHAYAVIENTKLASHITALPHDAKLHSLKVWYTNVNGDLFKTFKQVSEGYVFNSGEGLPGRVYQSGLVQTIFDVKKDGNFPRAQLVSDVGVRGAFAFPIKDKNHVTHVLEFFSPEPEHLNPSVLELMKHISNQVSRGYYGND
jgi:hypothetical protein